MGRKSRRVKFMEEVKKTRGDAIREGKRKAKEARQKEHEKKTLIYKQPKNYILDNSWVYNLNSTKDNEEGILTKIIEDNEKALKGLDDGKTYFDQDGINPNAIQSIARKQKWGELMNHVDEEMKKFEEGFSYKGSRGYRGPVDEKGFPINKDHLIIVGEGNKNNLPPTKDSLVTEPMKVICMELEWFEPKEALPVYNTTVLVVDDFNEMIVAARFLPDQGWLSLPADGEWESSRIRVRKWLRGLDPKVLEWEK